MIVLLDTSVLSLTFRRRDPALMSATQADVVATVKRLALAQNAALIGMVRQETLTGVRSTQQFQRLRTILDGFVHIPSEWQDHDSAAECFNRCRAGGVAPGDIDMLICAMAIRRSAAILTVDNDFHYYARHLPISLYQV